MIGTITKIKIRYNKYAYDDAYMKPAGVLAPEVRASFPNDMSIEGELKKFLREMKVSSFNEDLIGKKVMFKYYLKPDEKNPNKVYKVVRCTDIRNAKNAEDEIFVLNEVNKIDSVVGSKFIEKLMSYYYKKYNYPIPERVQIVKTVHKGGLIKLYMKGIVIPVNIIDFETFYATILLSHKLNPKSDAHNVYSKILQLLCERKQRLSESDEQLEELDKIKTVIEVMTGCLNSENFLFNDPEVHNEMLKEGRFILKKVIGYIENRKQYFTDYNLGHLDIVSCHTDGLILKVRKKECKQYLIPKLNAFLKNTFLGSYILKHKGDYMRGIFKDVNSYALYNRNHQVKVKGKFFKGCENLVNIFLECSYYGDYSNYDALKQEVIKKNKDKQLMKVLDFLEKCKG